MQIRLNFTKIDVKINLKMCPVEPLFHLMEGIVCQDGLYFISSSNTREEATVYIISYNEYFILKMIEGE